jgi:hypothetical protein
MKAIKQISIDALNMHLFETIEMLKNNTDENASPNEKMDVETARTIASLGKVVIDGYKIKSNVLAILSRTENLNRTKEMGGNLNLLENGTETDKTTV